jgi:hypothetical protein
MPAHALAVGDVAREEDEHVREPARGRLRIDDRRIVTDAGDRAGLVRDARSIMTGTFMVLAAWKLSSAFR